MSFHTTTKILIFITCTPSETTVTPAFSGFYFFVPKIMNTCPLCSTTLISADHSELQIKLIQLSALLDCGCVHVFRWVFVGYGHAISLTCPCTDTHAYVHWMTLMVGPSFLPQIPSAGSELTHEQERRLQKLRSYRGQTERTRLTNDSIGKFMRDFAN